MTKKHFIALANTIKRHNRCYFESTEDATNCTVFTLQHQQVLADFCKQQNPQFNRERWLAYIAGECGPSGGTIKK